jgi:hypothetical protein
MKPGQDDFPDYYQYSRTRAISLRPEDFLYKFGMVFIEFDVEINKKNMCRVSANLFKILHTLPLRLRAVGNLNP